MTSNYNSVIFLILSQAIEEEGGDAETIEIPLPADTPNKKNAKAKGNLTFLIFQLLFNISVSISDDITPLLP